MRVFASILICILIGYSSIASSAVVTCRVDDRVASTIGNSIAHDVCLEFKSAGEGILKEIDPHDFYREIAIFISESTSYSASWDRRNRRIIIPSSLIALIDAISDYLAIATLKLKL